MFSLKSKPVSRPAPLLRRVLIVDAQEASARGIADLLAQGGRPEVWTAPTAAKALKLAAKVDPDLIVCALSGEKLDGLALVRSLRRSDLACRQAPVILTCAAASDATVLAARDAGVHEVASRPFTARDFSRCIEAALSPREWVEAMDYVGPDRRSFNAAAIPDGGRRSGDAAAAPHEVRCSQALKIIGAAVAGLEGDPHQARRAMLAQAEILQSAAGEMGESHLAAASLALRGYLTGRAGEVLDRAEIEQRVAPLLHHLRREERRAA